MHADGIHAEIRLTGYAMLFGKDDTVLLLKEIHQQPLEAERIQLMEGHRVGVVDRRRGK